MQIEKKTIEEEVSPAAERIESIELSEVSEKDLDKVSGGLIALL